ncbi:MAG TPA: hypothetical protein VNL98_06780 [Gemmatimonadales bacterium]|nr:hypothetical protein [Gemmatimonadales bacterium]
MIVYEFAPGSRLQGDAQRVGHALARLANRDAAAVVEAARSRRSVLHGYFEWDDRAAAHEYRLEQARLLVRSVIIVERRPDAEMPMRVARAFEWVRRPDDHDGGAGPRVFVTQARVQRDPALYAQVLAELRRDLEAYRRRLSEFEGAKSLLAAIDAVLQVAA